MPIFPVLELEEILQEGDKTRLDGSKSFVSGTTAITIVEIKPTKLVALVDVTTSKSLDWVYAFEVDVDAINNKVNFSEGGPELTATLATGAYSMSALATELSTKLNAVGGQVYIVSVNALNVFTISAPGVFSLLVSTGTNKSVSAYSHFGYSGDDLSGLNTYSGSAVETVEKIVSIKVTNATLNQTVAKTFNVISEVADKLFSSDARIRQHEPDVLKFVQAGRASFKDIHRRTQGMVLAWLDKEGQVDSLGNKLTKASVVDIQEVQEWATFMALRLVFEGISNAVDDVFSLKARRYLELEVASRNRAVLRLDLDGDGEASLSEEVDIRNCIVVRR